MILKVIKIYTGNAPLDGLGHDFGKSISKQILKRFSPDSFYMVSPKL